MDPDQGHGTTERLGGPADLNAAWSPRIGARKIVDDDRRLPGPLDVAVLLALLEAASPDVDRVVLAVIREADWDDVGRAVAPDRRQSPQPPLAAGQVADLYLAECAHNAHPRTGPVRSPGAIGPRTAGR